MKAEIQSSAELSLLGKLIENISVAMLTGNDADGMLVSQPMAPLEMDAEGALWFFADLRSTRVEHLRFINLSFTDPTTATYVSLSGWGEIHSNRSHVEQLWTESATPWFPDGPDSTNLALLKFVPDAAAYWDAPHSQMVRLFAMAASVMAGQPFMLGGHGTFTELPKHAANAASRQSTATVLRPMLRSRKEKKERQGEWRADAGVTNGNGRPVQPG